MLAGIPSPEQLKEEEFRERMMEVVKDKRRNRYVCDSISKEEIIGYFGIYAGENDPEKGWIFFFVQDAYQRKGLGWMILKHIVEEASSSLGLRTLGAQVYWENNRAIRLLKRYNFEVQNESIDPESNRRSYMMKRAVIAYSFKTIDVQGIRYRVVKEPEIKNYLFETLRAEWEEKEFNEEWYPEMGKWNWSMEELAISGIRLWKPLMEDPTFISDLERRTRIVRELISQDEPIEPVVVRGRDMVIYDGYARLHALKQLGKSRILAYVGRNNHRT